jgi:hypothetical protein
MLSATPRRMENISTWGPLFFCNRPRKAAIVDTAVEQERVETAVPQSFHRNGY